MASADTAYCGQIAIRDLRWLAVRIPLSQISRCVVRLERPTGPNILATESRRLGEGSFGIGFLSKRRNFERMSTSRPHWHFVRYEEIRQKGGEEYCERLMRVTHLRIEVRLTLSFAGSG